MAYATRYRSIFNSRNGHKILFEIEDESGLSVETLTIASMVYEDPEGDQDKLAGVKPSILKFEALFNKDFDPETLLPSSDTQYKVKLYINSILNWTGWLDGGGFQWSLKDSNYLVQLQAKDGLHLLASSEFVNTADNYIWGSERLSNIFIYCLRKTELGLNLRNWVNIYPDGATVRANGFPERDPFYITYINSGTFRDQAGNYEKPIDILNKICLSMNLRLFQSRGEWNIVHVEDWIQNQGLSCSRFDSSGTPIDVFLDQRHRLDIGYQKTIKFINEDALVSIQKPYKYVETSFNYDSVELFRNEDLSRGDFIDYVGLTDVTARYELEGWTEGGTTTAREFYIDADLFIANQRTTERFRYIAETGTGSLSLAQEVTLTLSPFNLLGGDRFSLSFKFSNIPAVTTNGTRCRIDFKLTSGATERWLGADGKWKLNRQFLAVGAGIQSVGTYYPDTAPFVFNISTVDPVPEDGEMEIYLSYYQVNGTVNNSGATLSKIWDFNFDYTPSISAYQFEASGHVYKNEGTGVKNEYQELKVYVNDGLNINHKGVLYNASSSLVNYWFHEGVTEEVKLGQLLNRGKWKCYWRNFYKLEGTLLNVITSNYLISPLNTIIYYGPTGDNLNGKEFIICTLRNVDIVNDTAEGTFVELLNTGDTLDFDETGTETFEFLDIKDIRVNPEQNLKNPPKGINILLKYGPIGWVFWNIFGGGKKK